MRHLFVNTRFLPLGIVLALLMACGGDSPSAPPSTPTDKPVIQSFAPSAGAVDYGASATLSWSIPESASLTTLTVDGIDVKGRTSLVVKPRFRQTYTLSATNAAGSATRTVTVAARGLDVVAGVWDGIGYRDGNQVQARFGEVCPIARDSAGSLYIADQFALRKITPDGSVALLAGDPRWGGYLDGAFLTARFGLINSIALDEASGLIYVADRDAGAIRVLDLNTEQVSTLVGGPGKWTPSYLNPQLLTPISLASGPNLAGNMFQIVLDKAHDRLYIPMAYASIEQVFMVDLSKQTIESYAGGISNGTGNARLQANIGSPTALAVDPQGNLYIGSSYTSLLLYKVDFATGVVTAWADQNISSIQCLHWHQGTSTLIAMTTRSINMSPVYVVDRIDPSTHVSTPLAGGTSGTADGIGASAQFVGWDLVHTELSGDQYYLMDSGRVRILDLVTHALTTQEGATVYWGPFSDGPGAEARISGMNGSVWDEQGNLYFCDAHAIRKMSPDGAIATIAGNVATSGQVDGPGAQARFGNITHLVRDALGNLYLVDGAIAIRKITPDGTVSTLAGDLIQSGFVDGEGAIARFVQINGLALDAAGNLYAADTGTTYEQSGNISVAAIRRVTPAGSVVTLAGGQHSSDPAKRALADGKGTAAVFGAVHGLWTDPAGNLYTLDSSLLADQGAAVRRIALDGTVNTIAGSLTSRGLVDGTGSQARLMGTNVYQPFHADAQGNVYLWEVSSSDFVARRVTPAGEVTTLTTPLLATESAALDLDGSTGPGGTSRCMNFVDELVPDPLTGNVYVVEYWMNAIRKITPEGQLVSILRRGVNEPGALDRTGVWRPGNVVVTPSGDLLFGTPSAILQVTAP